MSQPIGYARHFIACNQHKLSDFTPLYIDGKRYGYVLNDLATLLAREAGVFRKHGDGIELDPQFGDFSSRSEALMQATRWVAAHYGKSLRNEMYAFVENWEDEPVAQIDRAAIPWFGARAWGVHVNGYVRKKDGIYLWAGERAANRPSAPGQLDNMIGGGQPIGLTLEQNLCKEAMEEAGIEAELALTAKPAGAVNYRQARQDGLRTDTLFIYDLELPEDYMPRNTDGEVAAFHLMPLAEAAAIVRETDRFKLNCNLVVIDFLMRHGFITERDAEYGELVKWMKG